MRKQYDRVFVLKFPVSGFVAGLVLVLLVFAVQILYRGENLSLRVVGQFHNEYPMLYLVDLLP